MSYGRLSSLHKAFYEHWVCIFDKLGSVIVDQGRQFESQLFSNLAAICGTKVLCTTPYIPQCNSKSERFHWNLKSTIKAHNMKWTEVISTVLLGLRSEIRCDTNYGTNGLRNKH